MKFAGGRALVDCVKTPKILFVLAGLLVFPALRGEAQIPYLPENSRIFDATGQPRTLDQIVAAAGQADVIFLGEDHDDAAGHALEAEVLKRITEKYGTSRPIALSMEMFERDTQVVLNEYLRDLITEKHFLASSRPWNNYATDYRPLVEFARAHDLPVIAANAPRRYVNMVSRKGRASLQALSPEAKRWLAPLPYPTASTAYTRKFNALMGGAHEGSTAMTNILDSQTLWDATMGYSIAEFLKTHPKGLVIQVNGRFHSENRLGTAEQFLKYRPAARAVVVSIRPDESFPHFDKATQENLGDFVVVTDPKLPRSGKEVESNK